MYQPHFLSLRQVQLLALAANQLARSTSASVLPSTTTAGGDEEMADDRQEEGVESILPEHERVLADQYAAVVYLFLSEPRLSFVFL